MKLFSGLPLAIVCGLMFIGCNETHEKVTPNLPEITTGFFANYDDSTKAYSLMDYKNAKKYCKNHNGRLPTRQEAKYQIKFTKTNGWIHTNDFYSFWTSDDCTFESWGLKSKCAVKVSNIDNPEIYPAEEHNDIAVGVFCIKE